MPNERLVISSNSLRCLFWIPSDSYLGNPKCIDSWIFVTFYQACSEFAKVKQFYCSLIKIPNLFLRLHTINVSSQEISSKNQRYLTAPWKNRVNGVHLGVFRIEITPNLLCQVCRDSGVINVQRALCHNFALANEMKIYGMCSDKLTLFNASENYPV